MVGLIHCVTFSDRLAVLLRAKNWNPAQFATKAGIAKQTAYNWYNGGFPKQAKHWNAVADAFGLRVEDLQDERSPLPEWAEKYVAAKDSEDPNDIEGLFMPMNYAGVVPASTNWGDPLTVSDETRQVPSFMFAPGRFCASVAGYSCAPKVMPKDLLIATPTSDPIDGTLVLAERADDHGVTVKRAVLDEKTMLVHLVPLNPNVEPLDDRQEWKTVGIVCGVYNPDTEPMTALYWPTGLRPNRMPNRLEIG
ncbi:MAG: hypothetical protein EOP84_12190 [Verrucomicrobiaceae bacterium]|nr:MAG: hypothetical protein EOP84_12190 [Verrucomicrobiaceae bacterium]